MGLGQNNPANALISLSSFNDMEIIFYYCIMWNEQIEQESFPLFPS